MCSDVLARRMRRRNRNPAMHLKPSLDFSASKVLLSAGLTCARGLGVNINLAVVDDGGELVAFTRMDGVRSFTVELGSEKAKAAAKFGLSTVVLEQVGRQSSSGSPWSAGGLPVIYQGQCGGAVGVSGVRAEIDQDIAEMAIAAIAAA